MRLSLDELEQIRPVLEEVLVLYKGWGEDTMTWNEGEDTLVPGIRRGQDLGRFCGSRTFFGGEMKWLEGL